MQPGEEGEGSRTRHPVARLRGLCSPSRPEAKGYPRSSGTVVLGAESFHGAGEGNGGGATQPAFCSVCILLLACEREGVAARLLEASYLKVKEPPIVPASWAPAHPEVRAFLKASFPGKTKL